MTAPAAALRQLAVPHRLAASDPGWTDETDVCVIGSGVAGLTAALHARQAGLRVTVVTKERIDDGSTRWAQGGIAAVLDPHDTPAAHAEDTHIAGVGLCDPAAVDVLVTEGPARVRELIRFGAEFDRNDDGSLALTREGGHHANRIVHAGGDASGAEVQRALHAAVRRDPWIKMVEHALVLDLLTDRTGRAAGVTLHVLDEGSPDGVGAILARAVVLATGGMGQVFAATTNPVVSTGDGVGLALRAGAAVTDLEFLQFHPTALYLGGRDALAQQPLVSEALRGEGGHLVDAAGNRFMVGRHELAELAPRDVVAKNIVRTMLAQNVEHVFLDARHLGREMLERRFPTITARCRQAGIDPVTDPIPVAPAAHYAPGGVRTDLSGRTSVPGLYACGEVACTGVHGANRLASNSLLEALVFSARICADLTRDLPPQADPVPGEGAAWAVDPSVRERLQKTMSRGAGVLRSGESLAATAAELAELAESRAPASAPAWEATNLVTVAGTLLAAASSRRETRGCHWREDFADADPAWLGHLVATIGPGGRIAQTFEESR
ncbi:L-aspartate oxidase [Actinocatenispora thailandica]|uniref:L-aspartate oxidase n=1 Tax=Actinocatenispora thailandica TaxID=227318 RepID=A0A7R7I022_9ACTN|nr:L-aspartate oxidase [Actinocatenispora thailandica]BCJ38121.1 L-aspartate oxidase [Actinocatenispora thailandica]